MVAFAILVLAIVGVILMIAILGSFMAVLFVKRPDQNEIRARADDEQGVIVDMDALFDGQQQPGLTVMSNDVMEAASPRHPPMNRQILSVVDQLEQIDVGENRRNSDKIVSEISSLDPLTEKITLDY